MTLAIDSARARDVIWEQFENLERMVFTNGAVLASPYGHYQNHWIRDGLYTLEAYKHHKTHKRTVQLVNAPMNILHRYERKIRHAIRKTPDAPYKFFHSRYDPHTLAELDEPWGHHQLDAIGAFLFQVADLLLEYPTFLRELDIGHHRSTIVINNVTRYLGSIKYWKSEDFGAWEEGPDLHASSIGAVVGGLQKLEEFNVKSGSCELFFELELLDKGREALKRILPRETNNPDHGPNRDRACDLAQLSLIWPFEVLDDEQTDAVLEQVEKELVRDHGVIRYAYDPYYNAADERLVRTQLDTGDQAVTYRPGDTREMPAVRAGTEAEWPLGFAWLSIVHSHLARKRGGSRAERHREKAEVYWERLLESAVPVEGTVSGLIPELYSGDLPNGNTPLTWSSAFAVVAAVKRTGLRSG